MPLDGARRTTEYYSVRDSIVGTITGAITNATIASIKVTTAYDFFIINDGAGTITVTFNTTTNVGLPIAPFEQYSESQTEIKEIYLTNASGTTTSYRMVLKGE